MSQNNCPVCDMLNIFHIAKACEIHDNEAITCDEYDNYQDMCDDADLDTYESNYLSSYAD